MLMVNFIVIYYLVTICFCYINYLHNLIAPFSDVYCFSLRLVVDLIFGWTTSPWSAAAFGWSALF